MQEKMTSYFDAGAKEVWVCHEAGKVEFYDSQGKINPSKLVKDFPQTIQL